jgi:predicted kinase
MRKWMQEKLKRRKKSPPSPDAGTQPAPLQPAYFESEPQVAQTAPAASESAPEPKSAYVIEPGNAADPVPAPEARATDGGRPTRRRRGRGGRGRRRPGQPSPASASVSADDSTAIAAPGASRPEPARAAKGIVVLAVGLPGSGKSSWFKRHSVTPLSSDLLRTLLFDDPAEQRFQDLVFSNLRSMLKARLISRRPMNYVDATNLTPQERHNWIKLAKDFGYEVHAVFFDVPLDVCIERHHRRDRIVPEDVMRKMAAKLKAPTFEEGFAKITVVRVKQKAE